MKVKGSRRLIRHLGLALAVAAITAPAAQAMPMVADSSGPVAAPLQYADDLHSSLPLRASAVGPIAIKTADDLHSSLPLRASVESAPIKNNFEPINTQARPDLIQPANEAVSADSSNFEWNVATVGGIVSVLGLMLLGVGVLLAGRHSRKGRLAAT